MRKIFGTLSHFRPCSLVNDRRFDQETNGSDLVQKDKQNTRERGLRPKTLDSSVLLNVFVASLVYNLGVKGDFWATRKQLCYAPDYVTIHFTVAS